MRAGRTTLILGCMFSGKTTHMFSLIKSAVIGGKNACIIGHRQDVRYSRKALVLSHDNQIMQAIKVDSLETEPVQLPVDVHVIGIDEGHFFPGLAAFCDAQNYKGRDVVVAALNGDSERRPWTHVQELIPLAHTILTMHGVCVLCQSEASCSRKITVEQSAPNEIDVGGGDMYVSTCLDCYRKPIPESVLVARRAAVERVKQMTHIK